MKKILSLIIVGILVVSGVGIVALPVKEVKDKEITLSFSHLLLKEINNCVALELDGANLLLVKKDHYIVPTKIETFSFPFGTRITDVQCTPCDIHGQVLAGELMVASEPVVTGHVSSDEKIQRSTNPISINSWFSYDVGCGINNNKRCVFVKVQVFPVQYYLSKNMIKWAKDIKINIKYREPDQATVSFDSDYSFIVLTPSKYIDELQPLVDHKNGRGVSTKLVTLDEIYSSSYFPLNGRDKQEQIKYFIKDAIEQWGTSFVLLVGGSEEFPTRKSHIYIQGDTETFVSDLYYADIYNKTSDFSSWDTNNNNVFAEYNWGGSRLTDEVDLYPDVYLGRLACVDSDEVNTCVNKIIIYENSKAYTQEWFSNLVVCGGDSFTTVDGDSSGVNEGEFVNEAIIDIMDDFTPGRLWASNGNLSGTNGTRKINDAIDKGCGFVDFSGHGTTDRWRTHPHNSSHNIWLPTPVGFYKNAHVASLSNGEKLPIVVSSGCSCSNFDADDNCFGWAFVSNPDGGGIGSFGATALSWEHVGKSVTEGLIEKMVLNIFKAYKNESGKTFGEIWCRAITNYIFPDMENMDYKTIEEWQPFGDPTLAIADKSDPPVKPDAPKGPASGIANKEYTYIASTTDPNDDKLYYMFSWGDGSFSGWVGPFPSENNATTSHKWDEKGKYEIIVKAKDEHGMQSGWSDPLAISMPKNKVICTHLLHRLFDRYPAILALLD